MRLDRRPTERIDRESEVVFYYGGKPVEAFEGDTIGSAYSPPAGGSFPGASSTTARAGSSTAPVCPNCMMQVDGVPNVRVCAEPVRGGM